mgnify:FL=1
MRVLKAEARIEDEGDSEDFRGRLATTAALKMARSRIGSKVGQSMSRTGSIAGYQPRMSMQAFRQPSGLFTGMMPTVNETTYVHVLNPNTPYAPGLSNMFVSYRRRLSEFMRVFN